MKITYIKRAVFNLSSRKRQKKGFLPILGAIAKL